MTHGRNDELLLVRFYGAASALIGKKLRPPGNAHVIMAFVGVVEARRRVPGIDAGRVPRERITGIAVGANFNSQ